MKLVGFIMAFLLVGLSCLPCADKDAEGLLNTSLNVEGSSHNNEHEKSDYCSPFCQCACCTVFSINHPIPSSEINVDPNCLHFSLFRSINVKGITVPVWQPPQLS